MTKLKEEFWDRIGKVQGAMLGLASDTRLVPMSPQIDDDDHSAIWFITAQGTDLVNGVQGGPQPARLVISNDKAGLYGDVAGSLELSHDKEKLDELWSAVAAAWFEEGREDPDVRLLRFTPATAEVWVSTDSGIKFIYEVAKANLTGDKPDEGDHGSVTF